MKISYGSLRAIISGPQKVELPGLGLWKIHSSLPDGAQLFRFWPGVGQHQNTETSSNIKTATLPYLFIDECDFRAGVHLWRGYFNGNATGVFLNVQGGITHGWPAFLNAHSLGLLWQPFLSNI
jgi:hypothetical protein